MTQECWEYQKTRLKDRFGEKNFTKEFCLLVAIECKSMSDYDFVNAMNVMIGSRLPSRPPLLADFREMRIASEKRKFNEEVAVAAKGWDTAALPRFLEKEYPGCKTAYEAMQVQILRNQVARANGG